MIARLFLTLIIIGTSHLTGPEAQVVLSQNQTHSNMLCCCSDLFSQLEASGQARAS
jgi:hypothetical protein